MIKYLIIGLLLIFSTFAEEYHQKHVDTLKLIFKMSENEEALFNKELSQLTESIEGTSLETINNGASAFRNGNEAEGVELFKDIEEENPYFELMTEVFKASLYKSKSKNMDYYHLYARMIYETDLREKQKIETGCILGSQFTYAELIKGEPKKKASFDKWLARKWQEFYGAKPGNWYMYPGRHFPINIEKIHEAINSIEENLLGLSKPGNNFNVNWKKVNNLRSDYFYRIKQYEWGYPEFHEIVSMLEELRLNVLSGNVKVAEKSFPILRSFIIGFEQRNQITDNIEEINKQIWAKYYYIRGVHLYLIGKAKMLKTLDAKEDIIGRKSASVYLNFTGRKGGDSIWVKKARKLYEHIQSQTQEWFGVSLQNFDYRLKEEK